MDVTSFTADHERAFTDRFGRRTRFSSRANQGRMLRGGERFVNARGE